MRHSKLGRRFGRRAAPPPGHVLQHGGLADQARADRHHAGQGQGPAARDRQATSRWPSAATCTARRLAAVAHARRGDGQEALRRAGAALQGSRRRLYARAEGRLSATAISAPLPSSSSSTATSTRGSLDSGPTEGRDERAKAAETTFRYAGHGAASAAAAHYLLQHRAGR